MTFPQTGARHGGRRMTVGLCVAIAVLAGCSHPNGRQIATAGGSATSSDPNRPAADLGKRATQFHDCMRQHGVDATLDYTTNTVTISPADKTQHAKVAAALDACRAYVPSPTLPTYSPQDVAKLEQWAACIRAHGVEQFPDPDPQTGQIKMSESVARAVKNNPNMRTATEACANMTPYSPGPSSNPTDGVG